MDNILKSANILIKNKHLKYFKWDQYISQDDKFVIDNIQTDGLFERDVYIFLQKFENSLLEVFGNQATITIDSDCGITIEENLKF